MKERDIVLSSEVKEFLFEMKWDACADLAQAVLAALSADQSPGATGTEVRLREIGGYLVHYRRLSKAEARSRNLKAGQILLIRIVPIIAGPLT